MLIQSNKQKKNPLFTENSFCAKGGPRMGKNANDE
jgi:hypothetical protein